MPKPESIYLYGTTAPPLFGRSHRDFGHGCIRVEFPAELGSPILANQKRRDVDQVLVEMQPGRQSVVPVREPVTVFLFSTTAIADRDTMKRSQNYWRSYN